MRALRSFLWLIDHPLVGIYACPVALAAGLYFAVTGPEWWEDFFNGHALGWLFSFWIGSGFAYMWWTLRRGAVELPGGDAGAAAIGIVALVLIGGVGMFTDPYLFGVAIWPGIAMLTPAIWRRLEGSTRAPPPREPEPPAPP